MAGSSAIPIATAEDYERRADKEMLRRYRRVADDFEQENRRLRESNRWVFWEGVATGIAMVGIVLWTI